MYHFLFQETLKLSADIKIWKPMNLFFKIQSCNMKSVLLFKYNDLRQKIFALVSFQDKQYGNNYQELRH